MAIHRAAKQAREFSFEDGFAIRTEYMRYHVLAVFLFDDIDEDINRRRVRFHERAQERFATGLVRGKLIGDVHLAVAALVEDRAFSSDEKRALPGDAKT